MRYPSLGTLECCGLTPQSFHSYGLCNLNLKFQICNLKFEIWNTPTFLWITPVNRVDLTPKSGFQNDFLFLGPTHRFYLCLSNKSFRMRQAFLLVEQLDGQASSGVGCPPTLTMLLDPSLHIFCYPRVERSISAAKDIDCPILPPSSLHPLDHS
jgi:hypothetical protein